MDMIDIINTAETIQNLLKFNSDSDTDRSPSSEHMEKKKKTRFEFSSLFKKLYFPEKEAKVSPYKVTHDEFGRPRTYIGTYEISNKLLGHGGNSVVQLGFDQNGKKVAIKCIQGSPTRLQKLKKEGLWSWEETKIMKLLKHPNVPKLLDMFVTESYIYLIMDYIEGEELFDCLKSSGTFSEERARKVFIQLLSAVQYLHSNRILHNDLKLENVMVGVNDQTTLIDFGHSSFLIDQIKRNISTLEYTAPEILLFGSADFSSDIWSLGILLFAMICGCLPFDGKEEFVRKKIVQAEYNIPQDMNISESCQDFISKMLQPDPKKRSNLEDLKSHPWFLQGLEYYRTDLINSSD